MKGRVGAFVLVGMAGFAVQIVVLAMATRSAWPLPLATALAVETAVLHNFCWHERWTWRDRIHDASWAVRFWRFHAATGIVSLVSNVALTWAFARFLHLPPLAANTLAVGAASVANFLAADRWVFARTAPALLGALCLMAPTSAAAAPPRETLEAWHVYVEEAEPRLLADRNTSCVPGAEPQGEARSVPGGRIHRWTGCTTVRGITVHALVEALIDAGTPPPQEDVLESRLLGRSSDTLHVYLKLIRRTIITVAYDTEHEMSFERHSAGLAKSRSVATRIVPERRRRPWVSVAAAVVLDLRPGRQRRADRARIPIPQPRRAAAHQAGSVTDHHESGA